MKHISILGSTGSIGTQTLDVVRTNKDIKVEALAAGSNISLLLEQIKEFQPKLVCVEYTDDTDLLFPVVKTCTPDSAVQQYLSATGLDDLKSMPIKVNYSFRNLGKYKRTQWAFQKEWRYLITSSPMGVREANPSTFEKQQELIRRLENKNQDAPYKQLFLELDDSVLESMEILLGPRMTEAEKILAIALLEKHGLGNQWKESSLRIR